MAGDVLLWKFANWKELLTELMMRIFYIDFFKIQLNIERAKFNKKKNNPTNKGRFKITSNFFYTQLDENTVIVVMCSK